MKTGTAVGYADEELRSYMATTKTSIESALKTLISGVSDTKLQPLLEYGLLSKGKRLRPILVLLSSECLGGRQESTMQLALSFELLHTATLVHDDIIDRDVSRRGTNTLCSKWSADGAILAGDALIALSINLAVDYGPQIMRTLSEVGLELCDGEYLDTTLSLETATEEDYFRKIRKKSASLFRGAAECGAIAARGTPVEIEALSRFGEHFGMAYQVNDDLEDLLDENQVSQDLRNGNVTLPFLDLHQHGIASAKKLLEENFGKRDVAINVGRDLNARMREAGAFEYCRNRAMEYSKMAEETLKDIRESAFKDYLRQFSGYVHRFEG